MAGIIVQNSLKVLTQNGECQIDLCIGDITLLDHNDKVDVVMVSAVSGNYVPSPTSVIGALERNLNISVHGLAQNKAEDLRNLYSCWWSQPLPEDKPYKRLLCFETRSCRGRPQELVANVYRCLVPMLNNEDGTVITPLLNTGDQGYGEVSMLEGMVVAAINWMKAGLPLRLLKIVLYAKLEDGKRVMNMSEVKGGILQKTNMRNFDKVCDTFAELKERYDSQYLVPKAVPIEFDVYLSYSKADKAVAEIIQERLKAAKSDIKIFGEKQELDKEAVWQQDMYQVMMRSARVVTVLTPNYLKCTECVEQYNIALCCNRRARRDMLAPIYVDTIEVMPTYMGLVQYVDCRTNDTEKIQKACTSLLQSMTTKIHLEVPVVDAAPIQYDVFLSYSHRDDTKANHMVKLLQEANPNLKIFFDMEELKTGKAWQRTLYHSIDGSRYLIALISQNYIRSAVCQEEYNLALAKHCLGDGSMQLLPLCIEDLKEVPATFSKIKMVKATADVFEPVASVVCKGLVSHLASKDVDQEIKQILKGEGNPSCNLHKVAEDQRRTDFMAKYGSLDKKKQAVEKSYPSRLQISEPVSNSSNSSGVVDVVFSCVEDDFKYAHFLRAILKDASPSLVTKVTVKSDQDRLTLMDTARCVVPILSPSYLDSPEQVEEFHIALCRHRISRTTVIFPVAVHALPQKPTYFHIVPCPVDITDALWMELARIFIPFQPNKMVTEADLKVKYMPAAALGLHEAAVILIGLLKTEDSTKAPDDKTYFSRPVLHNVLNIQDDIVDKSKGKPVPLKKAEKSAQAKKTETSRKASRTQKSRPRPYVPSVSPMPFRRFNPSSSTSSFRLDNRVCFQCGLRGHVRDNCPSLRRARQQSQLPGIPGVTTNTAR